MAATAKAHIPRYIGEVHHSICFTGAAWRLPPLLALTLSNPGLLEFTSFPDEVLHRVLDAFDLLLKQFCSYRLWFGETTPQEVIVPFDLLASRLLLQVSSVVTEAHEILVAPVPVDPAFIRGLMYHDRGSIGSMRVILTGTRGAPGLGTSSRLLFPTTTRVRPTGFGTLTFSNLLRIIGPYRLPA